MCIQTVERLERLVAFTTIEFSHRQVRLNMSRKQSLLDEPFCAMETFKLSLRVVRTNMLEALAFIFEKKSADVTSELFLVGVLQLMNFQTVRGLEAAAARTAVELSLAMHFKVSSMCILIDECLPTSFERASKRTGKIVSMDVQQLVLLEVAQRAESFFAVRKIAFELFSRMRGPDVC